MITLLRPWLDEGVPVQIQQASSAGGSGSLGVGVDGVDDHGARKQEDQGG